VTDELPINELAVELEFSNKETNEKHVHLQYMLLKFQAS
jgi:hypothetical protein